MRGGREVLRGGNFSSLFLFFSHSGRRTTGGMTGGTRGVVRGVGLGKGIGRGRGGDERSLAGHEG